jgi:hypothetical protein
MKTPDHNNLSTDDLAHVVAMARAHGRESGLSCRRWRRRALVSRCVFLSAITAITVTLALSLSASLVSQPFSTGAMSTAESIDNNRQTLALL